MSLQFRPSAASCVSLGRLSSVRALCLVAAVAATTACDDSGDSDSASPSGVASFGLDVADLNGDGWMDIVTANINQSTSPAQGSARVILQNNDGSGAFQDGVFYDMGFNTFGISTGDLDGDGRQDFLSANRSDALAYFRLQSPVEAGLFLDKVSLDAPLYPGATVVTDINGDTFDDVAISGRSLVLQYNYGSLPDSSPGTFYIGAVIGVEGTALAAGDLDGDGRTDLVAGSSDREIAVLLQDPYPLARGSFSTLATYTVGDNPVDIALADLDRDGRTDIAVVNRGSDGDLSTASVSVLFQSSAPFSGEPFNLAPRYSGEFLSARNYAIEGKGAQIVVADLNNDTLPDIAASNALAAGGGISLLLQTSPREFTYGPLLPANVPSGLGAADFDRDGFTDLAFSNSSGAAIYYQRPLLETGFGLPVSVGGDISEP